MNRPADPASGAAPEPAFVRLHPADNVVVLARTVEAGESLRVGDLTVVIERRLGLGHKLATCAIPAGARIVKYGVGIGSAAVPIAAGAHVHTHNLRSDYLPTYVHETQKSYFQAHP